MSSHPAPSAPVGATPTDAAPTGATPGRRLRVGVVQVGGMTEHVASNLERLSALIREAACGGSDPGGTVDLVVLPELITTPYFCAAGAIGTDRSAWAEALPGPTTAHLGALARELGVAIVVGLYERTPDGVFHNSVVAVDRDGSLAPWTTADGRSAPAYRKLSIPRATLGTAGIDEKHFFTPGPEPVVLDLLGVRFGCVICYDRSFPEYWAAARALGAEVVLAVVSSLTTREELFIAELRTRALESQVFVVAANRAGPETVAGTTVSYFGLSSVIAPGGALIAEAPAHESGVVLRADLDLDAVAATRAGFPLSTDRRPEVLDLVADLVSGRRSQPAAGPTGVEPATAAHALATT